MKFATLFLALLGGLLASHSNAKPPNIVLFIADDLSWHDIGPYGAKDVRTPNLDRLASQSMKFNAAIAVGLWLLGRPLALALGILVFVLEFIPYLGPILAAVPAVLIASTLGTQEMLYVVLLYWGVQSAEGYVLSPLVFQRSVHVPPMLTIAAQVVLGTMLGVLGVVFATPLTACALVLVNRIYIEDVLRDRPDDPIPGTAAAKR